MKVKSKWIAIAVLLFWAVFCFCFFQWYYPYHLVYREQIQLFLYASDYINAYFHQPAWMSCITGDYLTQFFYFDGGGPATITVLCLLLGGVFYIALGHLRFTNIDRFKHNNKFGNSLKILLTIAFITWEALRNCGLNYELASTISMIGGILIFIPYAMGSIRFRWMYGIMLLPLSYCLFGYGIWVFLLLMVVFEMKFHHYVLPLILSIIALTIPPILRQHYHLSRNQAYVYPTVPLFSKPDFIQEKLLAMDVESSFGHWSKVVRLTEKDDLHLNNATYFYNLSHGMQGGLPLQLLHEYQPGPLGLLIPLNPSTPFLSLWCSNEAWFQLGDMTMAEHAAMLAMIFSPNHRSSRMTKRLAEINLIRGDTTAALKYLRLLQKTWFYKAWADERIPGYESADTKTWLTQKRALLPKKDTIRNASNQRLSLQTLINNNPHNGMALDYLLCYDLLSKDINAFMHDYDAYKNLGTVMPNRLYSEALIIGLMKRNATPAIAQNYHIFQDVFTDFNTYSAQYEQSNGNGEVLQPNFGKTYWFYYHFATFIQP